ncbi:MAG: PP0621 family protein [Candidatus Thiodiazotropha sp. DIVDIV]
MGLKTILFGLAIWGIYLIVRHFARMRSEQQTAKRQVKSVESVKCDQCGLHLPKDEAIHEDGLYYCNKDHLLAAKSDKPSDNE